VGSVALTPTAYGREDWWTCSEGVRAMIGEAIAYGYDLLPITRRRIKPAGKALENEAAKRRPVFSALAFRDRPLAYTSTARVARKTPSSENPGAYFADRSPRFPNPFPRLPNLRFADT
jgi:hypothetical protein